METDQHRLVINVEAHVAQQLFDEADQIEADARATMEAAQQAAREAAQLELAVRAAADAGEQPPDGAELELLEKRDQARDQAREARALLERAKRTRHLARESVVRAKSLPNKISPDELLHQAAHHVKLTSRELKERERAAEAAAWETLRAERAARLAASDWMTLPDIAAAYGQQFVDAAHTYRQQLRDLPANTTDPASPPWPTPPATQT